PAQARGVDQRVAAAGALEGHLDRVARRARLVEGDDALLADQRVHQRGLADVRPADDRDARVAAVLVLVFRAFRKALEDRFEELAHALAVGRGDGDRIAQAELVELRGRRVALQALALVRGDGERRAHLAQLLGDQAVRRREPGARVDDEDHGVGLGDRLLGLARHLGEDVALLRRRLEAAGVDGDEGAPAGAAFAVVPVARHARHVVDDRVAAPGEAVKEGGLADVRTADKRYDRLHNASANRPPFCVWMSTPPPGSAAGAARTAPPLVA